MKLHILSDLHMEYSQFVPPATDADVVILAGDIDGGTDAIAWAIKNFKVPVIYVAGNHEHYGQAISENTRNLKQATEGTNVHFLHNDEIALQGVRFLGSTLWTDFRATGNQPQAELIAYREVKDYQFIEASPAVGLTPEYLRAEHARAVAFLDGALDTPFAGKTVVVTHHLPSMESVEAKYKERTSHLNAAYASNLERLMGQDRLALWVHGHTHTSWDYDMYGTRVVCNPRGYVVSPNESGSRVNSQFDPGLLVEI